MTTSNIFAGSDTTAASARAFVYFLLKNPEVERRFLEEIIEAHKAGRLSKIAQRAEVEQLPFTMACLFETLRFFPQPGMNMPRVTPTGGFDVAGHFIPQGVCHCVPVMCD